MQRLADGVLVAGGRVDDKMNLSVIKVSSAELERLFNRIDGVKESAAVAVSSGDGPDQLVVFAVLDGPADVETLKSEMNSQLRRHLNPLFKVQHVEIIESLPPTASNKVMRRTLRDRLLHASF